MSYHIARRLCSARWRLGGRYGCRHDAPSPPIGGRSKGKFVFKGDVKPEKIVPNKDTEYCSKHELIDESVVVGDGGELSNVFVYLNPGARQEGRRPSRHQAVGRAARARQSRAAVSSPHAMTAWTADKFEILQLGRRDRPQHERFDAVRQPEVQRAESRTARRSRSNSPRARAIRRRSPATFIRG